MEAFGGVFLILFAVLGAVYLDWRNYQQRLARKHELERGWRQHFRASEGGRD